MTRIMEDALFTKGITNNPAIAAWYPHDTRNTDGAPVGKQIVGIDNEGTHPELPILDVESGAASDQEAAVWVRDNTSGFPTVYRSFSFCPQLFAAMADVSRPWYLWVAKWVTGVPATPADPPNVPHNCTVIGQQYENFGPYDISIITDDGWMPVSNLEPSPSPAKGSYYVVRSGDSLSGIAARFGLADWDVLYQINKGVIGDNPNLIFPGQHIWIPGSYVRDYTVVSGDTLSGIAAKLGLADWEVLYDANIPVIGSNPNLIQPGQHLIIP